MKTKTFWVKLALVVLMLLFIWGNSALPGPVSGRESGFVLRFLEPAVTAVQRFLEARGHSLSQDYIVRKMAHFTEYAVLGVLMLALLVRPGVRTRPILSAGACLIAAAIDECIQIFSYSRGPAVRDVLLDFSGACFGVALAALALLILRTTKKHKSA